MHRDEKHGPAKGERLREETKRPVEARAEEGGSPEHRSDRPSMSPADVARRAELSRHLPPTEFPADRERLLAHLRSRRAPESVIDTVSKLPEGQEFRSVGEIVRTIGLHAHH